MNKTSELTLAKIRKLPKVAGEARTSALLSKEDKERLKALNEQTAKKKEAKFDDTDAYIAEIIARFGYDFYREWNKGSKDWPTDKVKRMVLAERAREQALLVPLEGIIMHMVGSCIKVSKKEKKPKGPKEASKIFKRVISIAKGEA